MILGHLTVTYVIREPLKKRFPAFEPLAPLLVGAYLPDIIDKPLKMILDAPGRGVTHSIIVLGFLFYALYRAFPEARKIIIPMAVGSFLHILQDFPPYLSTWLWPFLGGWPAIYSPGLIEGMHQYYVLGVTPIHLAVEIASYPFFFYFLWKNRRAAEPELKSEASTVQP